MENHTLVQQRWFGGWRSRVREDKGNSSRVNFEEDLILVPGRQAAEMIRRRANASGIIVATKG